jgi:hypothetical protein
MITAVSRPFSIRSTAPASGALLHCIAIKAMGVRRATDARNRNCFTGEQSGSHMRNGLGAIAVRVAEHDEDAAEIGIERELIR